MAKDFDKQQERMIQELVAKSVTFKFGDTQELCDELLDLVRSGKKTATCEALRAFTTADDNMPVVGRQDIALEWDGSRPALLLETMEITHQRFCDVTQDFALAEGENDDLQGWRKDHQEYFERTGGFDQEMMVVCERFRVIHDFAATTSSAAYKKKGHDDSWKVNRSRLDSRAKSSRGRSDARDDLGPVP